MNGTKSATITMKAGKTLTSEQVTKAIEGAGFKASDFMEKKAEEKKEEKKADDKKAAEMKPSSAK
ncbi:MAG: hypothetical protein L6Q71_09450 [Planctomycetes bacterium]|nr:hypothetical protein [Planctomycetota bacterium]